MEASVTLFTDPQRTEAADGVNLSEIVAPLGAEEILMGEAKAFYGRNTGNTTMRDLAVHIEGAGRENVQVARNEHGRPGLWAAAGESVIVAEGSLFPNEQFTFWARGVYNPKDAEAMLEFDLVMKGVSIG